MLNARLFFVKYFPKILITQVYVPTVRNKTQLFKTITTISIYN